MVNPVAEEAVSKVSNEEDMATHDLDVANHICLTML